MPFKKKKKDEEVATVKETKKEETKTESKPEQENIDLLSMAEPERDYVYNSRIINELTAIRAAILELTNEVKKE